MTTTGADVDLAAWVRRSRERCGLPPTVEDEAALDRVAVLMTAGDDDDPED